MPAWLDRLTGGSARSASSLAQQLSRYRPYEAPYAGPATEWTLAQAEANLQYLLQHRTERLEVLSALLTGFGIQTTPALTGDDPGAFVDSLHRWANAEWPALHEPRLATRERWLRSSRRGTEIVYSLLMDVAILLGELIVRRRPTIAWALDLDETNGRDGMTSFRRPVLVTRRQGDGMQVEIDVEEIVVTRYLQPRSPGLTHLNGWKQLVADSTAGAYERPL
jgi:hypothetical protein